MEAIPALLRFVGTTEDLMRIPLVFCLACCGKKVNKTPRETQGQILTRPSFFSCIIGFFVLFASFTHFVSHPSCDGKIAVQLSY